MSEHPIAGAQGSGVVRQHFIESADLMRRAAEELASPVAQAARMIAKSLQGRHKVLVCGNGGSAADAQHFVGELVGRFKVPKRPALAAIALTTDGTVLTCIANDFSYEEVFSRQVEALAEPGDVVIGISTSGRSPNVLLALRAAHERGAQTLVMAGDDGGAAAREADLALIVPSTDTALIQECHITLIHALCEIIETVLTAG